MISVLLGLLATAGAVELPDDPAFDPARSALGAGDQDAAAAALLALVSRAPEPEPEPEGEPGVRKTRPPATVPSPGGVDVEGAAWRALAEIIEGKGLQLAALIAWSKAIEADPQGAAAHIKGAIDLAEEVSDTGVLAPVLGKNVGIEGLEANTRSRMAYLAARYHLRAGNYGTASGILMMVDKNAPVFADAEALRGIVLSQQGRYNDALAPLLTAQGAAKQRNKGQRFDDIMNLNVARAYYAAGNYLQAVTWFTKVSRGSDYWPEAQFERAWAHFRANDLQATYALLMAHDSPFFDDWYFAEGDLLRAYALFMLCKFPEASKEMDEFVATYTPLKGEIDSTLASMSADDAFTDVRGWVEDGVDPQLPVGLLREFRNEDRLAEAFAAVDHADAELERIAALPAGDLKDAVGDWVEARAAEKVDIEGGRILERVRHAQTELGDMLQGIEITRLDLLQLEATMYERAAATGVLDYGDRIGKLRDLRKRKKQYQIWPFQGEYWADELGWYVVDSRPDCPANLQVGGGEGE